ncbi:hypothetical protein [Ruegeria jejuensis]|uniref:hypothetical protein n=1 Tax=Ruegeria jejuensis TaxID=3233338 RepID=UPI00355B3A15
MSVTESWTRIHTRAAFCAFIADCRFEGPGLRFVIHQDGRLDGTAEGVAFEGSWEWKQGCFCRILNHPDTPGERECEIIETRGAQMRYTRDGGQCDAHVVRKVPL